MAAEIITAQEATEKSIGLYGKIITERLNREIRPEVKIIEDPNMFGACIFCQMESCLVHKTDSLKEIQETLNSDFLIFDDKIQKYKLTELIPARRKKEILFFMEIAYLAFQISRKDLSFLKAFVELCVMSEINDDLYVDAQLEKVTGYLGEGWENRIKRIFMKYFDSHSERLFLNNLCETLKGDFDFMKKDGGPFRP